MKVLLVTPPMSDLNTPYPATAYLTGFLRSRGTAAVQADWSIELAERLFSADGLERLRGRASRRATPAFRHFLDHLPGYVAALDLVLPYLREGGTQRERDILESGAVPAGPRVGRFLSARDGAPPADRAHHLATLCLSDLAEVVREQDPGFRLSAWAADVAQYPRFDSVLRFLRRTEGGLVSELVAEVVDEGLRRHEPDVLGITVPFPGNLVGALRVAQTARRMRPDLPLVLGGGYANCYLRDLADPRVFDFVDHITLDDGEGPLWFLLEHLQGLRPVQDLHRTFRRTAEGQVVYHPARPGADIAFRDAATPSYVGLPLERYLATRFDLGRASSIWSLRWNKLTLAHGCYWGKCTFCDTTLDYVRRYEPQRAERLVQQIEDVLAETGRRDFHWVDEAAPPALLNALSEVLVERGLDLRWWGNVRFEKAFTPALAQRMAATGCVMVTGGLEVASDRLLALMQKGVTVAQVARVSKTLSDAGICVHAYLMYGFPTQTVQETVDSLEMVRQLFRAGCLHSGHWHRFMATEHSPIGKAPERHGIQLRRPRMWGSPVFASYAVPFTDRTRTPHDFLGLGLEHALRHFRVGAELDKPAHEWFPIPVPPTSVSPDLVECALAGSK